ncbi:hypothetical protein [Sphingobacterium tabacisoli]|uniref:Fibronectin type III domain-containing protein n=1 Tax=Sphingobacterium tabacisoli TaxID=2044855 RepID=A0ABW5KZJ2_9SPHI|nr:hypothetical protein [Sphingobacterium tabacisoli]
MKYIRAKANFFRLADEKLIVLGARIIECMKTSEVFTDPTPTIVQLEEAYEAYYEAVVPAASRSRETQALKRERKRVLADLFQQLVYYVNTVADGQLSLLYSSGFPVLTGKRTGVIPDTPTGIVLEDGRRTGEVAFRFTPVGRDMQYEYSFAVEDLNKKELVWGESLFTTRSFKTYQDGFTAGIYIYFKVRARNKNGVSDWSTAVRFLVR